MTYHQDILTLEMTILLNFNDQDLVLFVSPKDWKRLKAKLIGCQRENGNNAVEKPDTTFIQVAKINHP